MGLTFMKEKRKFNYLVLALVLLLLLMNFLTFILNRMG